MRSSNNKFIGQESRLEVYKGDKADVDTPKDYCGWTGLGVGTMDRCSIKEPMGTGSGSRGFKGLIIICEQV